MFEGIEVFRQRLARGEVLLGTGVTLADPQASDALADAVDFLWVDLEHAAMSPEALRGHLLACRSRRRAAVVRVPGSDTAFIKPVLDAGAPGLVVPQVRSVEEVRNVVADCRYSPAGRRGFGPQVPSDYGRRGGPEYVARANASVFVTVMVETVEAVEAIDAIVAVPGLDSVVLGPYDLSGSLGVLGQVEHPSVVEAMLRVIAAARKRGLPVGSGMGADPEYALLQASRGVQWLQIGGDLGYLVQFADRLMGDVRQRLRATPSAGGAAR
ncbi:MAG: aldolase/citrate lyase family protein [Gemmatimonadota bacterium]